jgi:hypothetical protein
MTTVYISVEREGLVRTVEVRGRLLEVDFSINSVVVEIDSAVFDTGEECALTEDEEEEANRAIYVAVCEDGDD